MRADRAITIGVYATLFIEILGFWVCGSAWRLDSRLFAIALAPGWIPVVVIGIGAAVRKSERLTWFDLALMVFGFPLVLASFVAASRYLL
jgi:hypothetical protein